MKRILVVNDDGLASEGISILAHALQALGTVTVVAPDGDRSGTSHSISAQHAVRAQAMPEGEIHRFACSGTPADCVLLGVNELCGSKPDLIVSGINRGANLADDVNYSGTVAAAVEATIVGVPAIAISLVSAWPEHDDVHHWNTAAAVAVQLAEEVLRDGLPPGVYLNVNVPNLVTPKGLRYTRMGRKQYADRLARVDDEGSNSVNGAAYFWVWDMSHLGGGDDTDTVAVDAGFISVTPLRIDRTDEPTLQHFTNREART